MSEAVPSFSFHAFSDFLETPHLPHLERYNLPKYLERQRWFAAKASIIKRLRIVESLVPPDSQFAILIVEVELSRQHTERYFLPLSLKLLNFSNKITDKYPQSVIAECSLSSKPAVLIDAIYDDDFRAFLFSSISTARSLKSKSSTFKFEKSNLDFFKAIPSSKVLSVEQSNSSIRYGSDLFMKVYRKLETGFNPDEEILSFLTETKSFEHAPKYVGSMRYVGSNGQTTSLALLQTFTKNKSSAWELTISEVKSFYKKLDHQEPVTIPDISFFKHLDAHPLALVKKNAGRFLTLASRLGERTAELHVALASSKRLAFKPERFTNDNQSELQAELISEATAALKLLRAKFETLPIDAKVHAELILNRRRKIFSQLKTVTESSIDVHKIRIHGDYHLGQVLFTGKDFIIIDFEGEPMRPIEERRKKRLAFQDLAGMIRSFHYAVYASLLQDATCSKSALPRLASFGELWFREVGRAFLKSYLDLAGNSPFVPKTLDEREQLLRTLLLSKAMYELRYELNHRPDWVIIPLRGIAQILSDSDA
ncbi:MAG: putative maltokinase [Chlorobiales bacterium]